MSRNKFYNTRKWRRASKNAAIRARFLCERCGEPMFGKGEYNTHHKRSVRQHPELAMVSANHQALCRSCHRQVETAAITGHGCDVHGNPLGPQHPWNLWRARP